MRRLTAAVSALACMGIVAAGTAASVESQPLESLLESSLEPGSLEPGPQQATSSGKLKPQAKYQRQAHHATNKQRVKHGLAELRRQDCVQRFAVRQAKAMAQREEMYHQDLAPVVEECGLTAAGENVAYGYPNGRSVVNDGWMHSDGHRANLLNPDFTLLGMGARKGHDGRWYVAQVFGREG